MSDLTYEEPKASKWPIIATITRVTTFVSIVVAMVILRSNRVTYTEGKDKHPITYHDIHTYKYVFFAEMVVFIYTIFQVPFIVYFLLAKKRLIKNYGFLLFEFYADKVSMLLLATAVGALFGATVETRNSSKEISHINNYDATDYRSKTREFCMMANVSGGFLILGFFCSIVSSIMSSIAL